MKYLKPTSIILTIAVITYVTVSLIINFVYWEWIHPLQWIFNMPSMSIDERIGIFWEAMIYVWFVIGVWTMYFKKEEKKAKKTKPSALEIADIIDAEIAKRYPPLTMEEVQKIVEKFRIDNPDSVIPTYHLKYIIKTLSP